MNNIQDSPIEWCHHTFNPWIGCEKVSAGCANCYAKLLMDTRYGRVKWGANGTRVRTGADTWQKPRSWDRRAKREGVRYRVFCASLADVFEEREELKPWRADLFRLIEATPHLDWQLLTKRPEAVARLWPAPWFSGKRTRPNVWLGTSVENDAVGWRIDAVRAVPAAVRFLSCEPLLGPVTGSLEGIDWVIVGGESGPGARPMHPEWARGLRDRCEAAGVPFFFKQWGAWIPEEAGGNDKGGKKIHEFPDGTRMVRVGKGSAGRVLDGKIHNALPGSALLEASRA